MLNGRIDDTAPIGHDIGNDIDDELAGAADIDIDDDEPLDPDRLAVCAYWRCGELFERRSRNHRYCRKACRSRQNRWARAQARRARR